MLNKTKKRSRNSQKCAFLFCRPISLKLLSLSLSLSDSLHSDSFSLSSNLLSFLFFYRLLMFGFLRRKFGPRVFHLHFWWIFISFLCRMPVLLKERNGLNALHGLCARLLFSFSFFFSFLPIFLLVYFQIDILLWFGSFFVKEKKRSNAFDLKRWQNHKVETK